MRVRREPNIRAGAGKVSVPKTAAQKPNGSVAARSPGSRDQAAGLRRLLGDIGPRLLPVAGGGDGAQRGRIVAGFAAAACAQGYAVVVLDQSRGEMAKILGLRPRYELHHLLSGEKQFDEVSVESSGGIRLIAAARGIAELSEQPLHANAFFHAFALLEHPATLVILHIEDASIAAALLPSPDAEVLLVAGADPAAMTGAYTHAKQMSMARGISNYRVLLCDAESESQAREAFDKLSATAGRFLNANLQWGGAIPCLAPPGGNRAPGARGALGGAASSGDPASTVFQQLVAAMPAWNLFESSAGAATH
ncbi:MAG: hypothetical protein ACKVQK_22200 [Burkholderiales bacterium]